MRHHTGLSNGFWIYAVKAKLHTYNFTLITRADYKTPTELWSSNQLIISHLRVFGCQAWVHILKKRRHKLEPKSREMIFIGYELGSKGYQFWDTAHHHIKISRDVKFNETLFPAKEATKSWASENEPPISESDNESDTSGLELVILAHSGIDYEETFSLVARYESIRYLLANAALLDWEIKAMDVKLAYLHGVLDEEIYMEQPEGFIAKGEENIVCRLV